MVWLLLALATPAVGTPAEVEAAVSQGLVVSYLAGGVVALPREAGGDGPLAIANGGMVAALVMGGSAGAASGYAIAHTYDPSLARVRGLWVGEVFGMWMGAAVAFRADPVTYLGPFDYYAVRYEVLVGAPVGGVVGVLVAGNVFDARELGFLGTGLVWGCVLSGEAAAILDGLGRAPLHVSAPGVMMSGAVLGLGAGLSAARFTDLEPGALWPLQAGGAVGTVVGVALGQRRPEGSAEIGSIPLAGTAIGLAGGAGVAALLAVAGGGAGRAPSVQVTPRPGGATLTLGGVGW